MATNFKLQTSHIIFTFIGIGIAVLIGLFLLPPETCEDQLDACEAKVARAFVVVDTPDVDTITPQKAGLLIERFSKSKFSVKEAFIGMNLHRNHLEQLIHYDIALRNTNSAYKGFRIYNGLNDTSPNDPTEDDIVQIIIPVREDGNDIWPADNNILSFKPVENFELPCPTRCDMTRYPSDQGEPNGSGG